MADSFVEDSFVADDDAAAMAANASRINRSQAKQNVARELSMQEDRGSQPMSDTLAHGALAFAKGLDWTGLADEGAGVMSAIPRLVPGGESPADAYRRGRDANREASAMGAEESDLATTLGDVAGQATGVLAGAAPAKAGIMGAVSVPTLIAKSAGLGGAAGGISGLGHSEGDAGQQAVDTALGAGVGALGGAALAGAPMALLKAAPSLGTTSLGQFARAPLQTVEDVGLQMGDSAGLVLQRARGALAGGGRNALAGAIEKAPAALGMAAGAALGGGPVGAAAGGMIGNTLLDDAAKALAGKVRNKPPVAGPANAAKPTLDVPEPVLVPADDIGMGPAQASGLDLDKTMAVDDVPTLSSLTASELAPLRERMRAASPQGAPVAGNPRDAAGNWSMTPDELNAAQGQVPGRPPVQIPSEGTSSMRRPRPTVEVDDAMVLESAPVPPAEPTASPVPDMPEPATVPVGGDKTARIPKEQLAELRLEAMAPAPKMDAPPPIVPDVAPVDPLQALAARARQRGINQRFSQGGERERAQLQALSGKAERQAFFDDLAQMHGQQQTAPLAKEFALSMPAGAPKRSTRQGFVRQASGVGAHTGRQEASGSPWRDEGGIGPMLRRATEDARAPVADDAAQGLALEAQAAATFDAQGNRVGGFSRDPNVPKYKPQSEAERAELMALPRDMFDAVVDGKMTLEQAQAPSLAKVAPAVDAERAAIEAAGGTVRDIEAVKGIPIRQIDLDDATVGAVRIVDKDGRETVIHRSTKSPGKWQASRFDTEGPSGDTQFSTLAEAVKHSRTNGGRVAEVQQGRAASAPKADTFDEPSFIRKSADEMGIEGDDLKSKTWRARELGDAIEPGYVRAQAEKRRKEMALPLDRGEALREILQENGIDVAGIKERKIGSVDNFDAGKDKKKIASLAQAWSKSTRAKKSWDEIGDDLDALAEALGVEKLRLPERVRNLMERHAIEDAPDLKTNPARKIPK